MVLFAPCFVLFQPMNFTHSIEATDLSLVALVSQAHETRINFIPVGCEATKSILS